MKLIRSEALEKRLEALTVHECRRLRESVDKTDFCLWTPADGLLRDVLSFVFTQADEADMIVWAMSRDNRVFFAKVVRRASGGAAPDIVDWWDRTFYSCAARSG